MGRRSRGTQPSIRIGLGKAQMIRAKDMVEGKPRYPILFDIEESVKLGGGTPPVAPKPQYLRADWLVEAAFIHGTQTSAKARNVSVSSTEACKQISQTFEVPYKAAVVDLATTFIDMVDKKNALPGFSAVCVAGACIFAAEKALGKLLLSKTMLTSLGIESKAVCCAFLQLQAKMCKSLRAVWTVIDAHGDPRRFPGAPEACGKETAHAQPKSRLTVIQDQMAHLGSSRLRTAVSVDDFPDPEQEQEPKKECGLQRVERDYAAPQDEMTMFEFDFEGGYPEADEPVVDLSTFLNPFVQI